MAEWLEPFLLLATVLGAGIMAERLASGNGAIIAGIAGIAQDDVVAFIGVQLFAAMLATLFFCRRLEDTADA